MNNLEETLKKEYHKAYRGILTDEFIDRSWEWTYGFFAPYMSQNSETPCDDAKRCKDFYEDLLPVAREKARKELVEEIVLFLDDLEMEQPEYAKTDNWRNWKYIRNSIRDKYLKSLEKGKHGDN